MGGASVRRSNRGMKVTMAVGLLLAALLPWTAFTAPARAAVPPGVTALPNGFGAIAIDAAHGHAFVSSPTTGVVTVLDLTATIVTTITGVPGAASLLVDGATLYVATSAGTIDAFSTLTFAKTGSFGAGVLDAPTALVKSGGRLWTATSSCVYNAPPSRLVSIDPGTGTVVVHPLIDRLESCPRLVADPAAPNTVLGYEGNRMPSTAIRLDVSGAAPVEATRRFIDLLYNTQQLAINPDGTTFTAAAGGDYQYQTYGISDLLERGAVYPSGAYPTAAVTTPANGGLIAVGRDVGGDDDLDVYRAGDPALQYVRHDLASGEDIWPRGLAFAPDGRSLLAVSGDPSDGRTMVEVVPIGSTILPVDPTTSFGEVAVDAPRKRVYVSAPEANAVRVFDLAGTELPTIHGIAGAGSLLVDGPNLYVASTAGTIDRIDTATMTRTARLAYGAPPARLVGGPPGRLVKAGGRIWFLRGYCSLRPRLASLDPTTGAVTEHQMPAVLGCVSLYGTPALPNAIFALSTGVTWTIISRISVATGAPTVLTLNKYLNPGPEHPYQLAFAPDATTFFVAGWSANGVEEFRTSDYTPTGVSYPTPGSVANAVAVVPSGGKLLGASRYGSQTPGAEVFRLGHPEVRPVVANLAPDVQSVDRGIAFLPDGSKFFRVAQHQVTGVVSLGVDTIAVPSTTSLASSVNPSVAGQPVQLTATTGLVGGGRANGGVVTFKDGASVLGTSFVRPDGTAVLTVPGLAVGAHPITATFYGPAYKPSTSTVVQQSVQQASVAAALTTSGSPARARTVVTFKATFVPVAPGAGTPTGYAVFYDGSTAIAVRSLVNGTAQYATGVLAVGSHAITVRYSGDTNFAPATSPVVTQTMT